MFKSFFEIINPQLHRDNVSYFVVSEAQTFEASKFN